MQLVLLNSRGLPSFVAEFGLGLFLRPTGQERVLIAVANAQKLGAQSAKVAARAAERNAHNAAAASDRMAKAARKAAQQQLDLRKQADQANASAARKAAIATEALRE